MMIDNKDPQLVPKLQAQLKEIDTELIPIQEERENLKKEVDSLERQLKKVQKKRQKQQQGIQDLTKEIDGQTTKLDIGAGKGVVIYRHQNNIKVKSIISFCFINDKVKPTYDFNNDLSQKLVLQVQGQTILLVNKTKVAVDIPAGTYIKIFILLSI